MTRLSLISAAGVLAAAVAGAAVADVPHVLTTIPPSALTVSEVYKQSVYDPSDAKIGDIADLILQEDGKITAAIVGVGGFLGVGEKDVAVPFAAIGQTTKNNKVYLVMKATKDELKTAPGFKYDRGTGKWVPETASKTQ
jgi:hypothetical protein